MNARLVGRRLTSRLVLLLLCAAALAGCGGSTAAGGESGTPSTSNAADAATPTRVDLQALFPPGPARDLVLNSCQNCHTFVPIVILQLDKDAWRRNSRDHRERVATLSDEQFAQVYEYLIENFGPHRAVPKLPPDLLKSWTTY